MAPEQPEKKPLTPHGFRVEVGFRVQGLGFRVQGPDETTRQSLPSPRLVEQRTGHLAGRKGGEGGGGGGSRARNPKPAALNPKPKTKVPWVREMWYTRGISGFPNERPGMKGACSYPEVL